MSQSQQLTIEQAISQAEKMARQGNVAVARQLYRAVLQHQPNHPIATNALRLLEKELLRHQSVQAQTANPSQDQINALIDLYHSGQMTKVEQVCRELLHTYPQSLTVLNVLGAVLAGQGRLQEAVQVFDKAIQLKPDYAQAYYNRGNVLTDLGQLEAAVDNYDQAIELQPDFAEAHWNLSLALLLLGNFEDGWREYEWRWETGNFEKPSHDFHEMLWDGTPLDGKTILLFAEQGFGDTIQFIRYVEEVAKYSGNIIVECQKPLFRLLLNVPKIDRLIIKGDHVPNFNVCAPLLSIPYILGTTSASIPANTPYLFANDNSVHLKNLQEKNKNVGIVWAGSPKHKNDRNRSTQLSNFLPLASLPGVQLFSLQAGSRRADLKRIINETTIIDATSEINDYADTAAIIGQLDLIISVDTSVAHLAGAMGKPVWVLLPFAPDYRWLLDRGDSPWYPTMQLYRQRSLGNWSDIFDEIERLLRAE